ncbi:MAG: PQQ-binding-like beta-propeller repeat protein [Myxococcales bacterium]|nr:PQQ-binding-like beta-propeller repeat protein [Myxococcales bacterium]
MSRRWVADISNYADGTLASDPLVVPLVDAGLVVLAPTEFRGPIIGFDLATGGQRFATRGFVAFADGAQVRVVGVDDDAPIPKPFVVVGFDPRTGTAGAPLRLTPPPIADGAYHFAHAGSALLVAGPDGLAAYDLGTGQRRWTVAATTPSASTMTAVGADLVIRADGQGFKGTTWVAHRVADGSVAWRHPREVVDTLHPNDDGRRVYLHRTGSLIELDTATGAATPLDANTASATWQVRLGDRAITATRRDGTGKPVQIPAPDGVVDLALAGDWLVEARLGAPTIDLHDLTSGGARPVCRRDEPGCRIDDLLALVAAPPYVVTLGSGSLAVFATGAAPTPGGPP